MNENVSDRFLVSMNRAEFTEDDDIKERVGTESVGTVDGDTSSLSSSLIIEKIVSDEIRDAQGREKDREQDRERGEN